MHPVRFPLPAALALLVLAPAAWAGTVTTTTRTILELQPPDPPKPPEPPGPWIAERDLRVEVVEGGLQIHGVWRIETVGSGWITRLLAGPGIRVEGASLGGQAAPVQSGPEGVVLAAKIDRPTELVVDAFVPGDPARAEVPFLLMSAARGRLDVRGTTLEPVVRGAVPAKGAWWSGSSELGLSLREPRTSEEVERPPLAVARVATGLTIGDAEVTGRAHVEWQIRQGSLSTVTFGVEGVGTDLAVTGESVSSWRREGDLVIVELDGAQTRRVSLAATWSAAVPPGEEVRIGVPRIAPGGAFRTESVLELARDGEIEVVPELQGAEPMAISALPPWAEGLVAGTPTVAFRLPGPPSGSLDLLRFLPAEQPAAVVDVANYTVATSDEGRVLARAHFTVRNERASHLRVVPPPGLQLLGVQVQGEPVVPGQDEGLGWLVPLPRSLETVEGLLSFPIEVIAIGEVGAWDAREERTIGLFAVDAPVAVSRLTLYLPPGYEGRMEAGEDRVVADFSEGETITYGYAVGDAAVAVVDAKFQEAVEAWMQNDFEEAQVKLDELKDMGVETENVAKLQSNLDVVSGKDDGDEVMARRVKDQARARAAEDEYRQQEVLREAEEAYRAGDYERAEASYEEALVLGDKLSKLEQNEAVEVDARNSSASSGYSASVAKNEAKEKEKAPERSRSIATKTPAADPYVLRDEDKPVAYEQKTEIDFESVEISGELVAPEGAYTIDGLNIADQLEEDMVLGGEVGGVEGGVAGGTVGGVLYGAAANENTYLPEEPLLPPDTGTELVPAWEEPPPDWLATESYGVGDATGSGYGYRAGGVAEGASGVVITQSEVQNVPVGRSYESVVVTAEARRSIAVLPGVMRGNGDRADRGERDGKMGGKGKSARGPEPVESPMQEISVGGDPDAPLEVQAAALTVLVPALGDAVRYQELLLPAEARFEVVVRAKESRESRRNR